MRALALVRTAAASRPGNCSVSKPGCSRAAAAPPPRQFAAGGSSSSSGSGSGGLCQQGCQQRQWQSLQLARSVVDGQGSSMTLEESDDERELKTETMMAAAEAGVRLKPSDELLQLIRSADAFTFDVDSTFCADESIDEIAAFLGVGEQVAALTAQAMGGQVLFQEALAARLGVMHPSLDDLNRFLAAHPPKISPGIPELVQLLKQQGKQVFLVSGGFRIVIHPIAEMMGIPLDHVFANTILFDHDGAYDGFDPKEFPSRSGGKAEAVQHIKKTHKFSTVVFVGDGITDFEARAPGGADAFIGYGGVVYRENVAKLSDWYVFSISDIANALKQ